MSTIEALSVRDLTVRIGKRQIFSNVSFNLAQGQFVTLMGENGVGKTTLLETLFGLRDSMAGQVLFFGKPLKDWETGDLNSLVAWVPSSPEEYPSGLTITDLIDSIKRMYPSWNEELCSRLCQEFSLDLRKDLSTLSMGEHSKVRLIKALSFEPHLLVLDELTANLSQASKDAVLRAIIELFAKTKMAVLYVCHLREEAVKLSDQILEMKSNGVTYEE